MTWYHRRQQSETAMWVAFVVAGLGISATAAMVNITDVLQVFIAGSIGAGIIGLLSHHFDLDAIPAFIGLTIGLSALLVWTFEPRHEPLEVALVVGWSLYMGAVGGFTWLVSRNVEPYIVGGVLGGAASFVPLMI